MRRGAAVVAVLLASFGAYAEPPGFSAGTGVYLVRPYFANNPAYNSTPFEWSVDRSHSFWAGYTLSSGWGVRFDAFLYDHHPGEHYLYLDVPAVIATPPTAGPFSLSSPSVVQAAGLGPDEMWFRGQLRVLRTEYEGTYSEWSDDGTLQLSAGLHYQLIRQGYHVDLNNRGDGRTMEHLTLCSTREFVGLGPTAAIFGSYRVAGPWSVYGRARGAIAFGTEDRQQEFFGILADPARVVGPGSGQWWASRRERVERMIPMTEVELGVEYRTDIGPLGVLLRGGLAAQSYFDVGGAAGGTGSLSLFGAHFAAGIRF